MNALHITIALLLLALLPMTASADQSEWLNTLLGVSNANASQPKLPTAQLIQQDFEKLQINRSIIGTPLRIGSRDFEHGLGTHSTSHIRIESPTPIANFTSWIGVDNNIRTGGNKGSISFAVVSDGKEIFRSKVLRGGQDPEKIDIKTNNCSTLDLFVYDGDDGPGWDHADWADATITTKDGKTMRLDELWTGRLKVNSKYPFSFTYNGKQSESFLDSWKKDQKAEELTSSSTQVTTTWTDPATGLKVTLQGITYSDFPAVEWLLYFENTGNADTAIIENVQALDLSLQAASESPYMLHMARGGVPNPTQFEPSTAVIDDKHPQSIGSETGRSSTKNFPFFKLEAGETSIVGAIGWSGCWKADFTSSGDTLHASAGMEKTHFLLHPGEQVRSPRILLLSWKGDTLEANAQFRQLIYKHYVARQNGRFPLPTVFCNTCFTRGGGWLNECNEENQISLIKAYASIGLEAMMTDAGWFTGGWPDGAGNWDVRKDAYPRGVGPVAAAAKDCDMIYGLWFEPERVINGTTVHKEHPEWCLKSQAGEEQTMLLNFGLSEVQNYFFKIVADFMTLPGFRVYRQDFNMDPLPYWRFNDSPDRQGITEIKYIEGLYAYWGQIKESWSNGLMEECASGGHRIDLETIKYLHIAQKTDYWFDDDVDQAALWSVSQYLPNNTIVSHLIRMDDYSFHSNLASSLCLGWIADAPDFDAKRGKALIKRYKEVRPLLIGAWYPLLPYPKDHTAYQDNAGFEYWRPENQTPHTEWVGSQYHRPDLNKGMLLVFRRAESPYSTIQVKLHGLDPDATYEIRFDSTKKTIKANGLELMKSLEITLPEKRSSDLIVYKRVQ